MDPVLKLDFRINNNKVNKNKNNNKKTETITTKTINDLILDPIGLCTSSSAVTWVVDR